MLTTTAPDTARDAVRSVLESWIAGVEQENLSLIAQIVAPDEDAVFISSGAGETIQGWSALKAALEAQAAAVKDIRITATDVAIHLLRGGQAAWATSLWDFEGRLGDQTISAALRCTWVCEQREQGWVLVHFHKSVGAAH
jgi:ketosteroid isomerase-like protein